MNKIFLLLIAFLCGTLHNVYALTDAKFDYTYKPKYGSNSYDESLIQMNNLVEKDNEHVTKIFQNIHQNPELSFQEFKTSAIIANELKNLGFKVTTGIGGTGVVGVLKNGEGPVVMYRADMDALPMEEKNNLPYASKVMGKTEDGTISHVSHMCGHDAHVAWLIGMARVMSSMKDKWSGTLVLVGQPAEEVLQGAKAMISDDMYAKYDIPKPDYLLGMHTAPLPVGTVANVPGTLFAGGEMLEVVFHGEGGHGSSPQYTKDPIIMTAYAIVEYQAIVSRIISPLEAAVITVGSIHAGSAPNIIPETSVLQVNLKFFNNATRDKMMKGIESINKGIATTYGVDKSKMPTMKILNSTTPLVNNKALVTRMDSPLKALLGEANVIKDLPPTTASEDIHLLLDKNTKAEFIFLLVGIADPKVFENARKAGKPAPYVPHNPGYIVDLKSIPVGSKIASHMVFEILKKN